MSDETARDFYDPPACPECGLEELVVSHAEQGWFVECENCHWASAYFLTRPKI